MSSVDQLLSADRFRSPRTAFGPPVTEMGMSHLLRVWRSPSSDPRSPNGMVTDHGHPSETNHGRHLQCFGSAMTARSRTATDEGNRPELAFLCTALRQEMARPPDSVVADGFRDPILVGDDSRLRDGHHRLAVAPALGISVPVEFVAREARRC
jgi:hypothetical protein